MSYGHERVIRVAVLIPQNSGCLLDKLKTFYKPYLSSVRSQTNFKYDDYHNNIIMLYYQNHPMWFAQGKWLVVIYDFQYLILL